MRGRMLSLSTFGGVQSISKLDGHRPLLPPPLNRVGEAVFAFVLSQRGVTGTVFSLAGPTGRIFRSEQIPAVAKILRPRREQVTKYFDGWI